MAVNDVAIRQSLNERGIGNERIGWDNTRKVVTVDGKDFLQSSNIQDERSYADPNVFNQALQQIQPTQSTQPAVNPYDTQINTLLSQLMNQIQSPQQFDPYSSPQYQAAQQQTQKQAQQGIRSAQESLGASGFGRSTNLADRAQRIQNQANQYLQTQILPQIIAQNQAQQQQQVGNLLNVLGATTQQQGVFGTRQQQQTENQLAQEQIAYQKLRDQIADERYKSEFDEDTRRFGLQFALEKQLQEGKLNLDQAQQSLRESQFETEQQGPSQQDLMAQAIQFAQRDPRATDPYSPPTQQEMNQIIQEYLGMLTQESQTPAQAPIPGLESFMNYATMLPPRSTQPAQTAQAPETETVTEVKTILNDADSKDGALNYIDGIKEFLTDAEYNQLIDYVNANF